MEKGGALLKEGAETPYKLVFVAFAETKYFLASLMAYIYLKISILVFVDSAEPKYSHKEFAGPQKRFSYPPKN